eukprot:PITA_30297
MEDLLVDKDQWIAVDLSTKPTRVTNEEWRKLDRKAKSTIRLCVSDSVLLNVSGEPTAKALWDKSGTLYQSKSMVNKLFLRKKLYNLRMKDGESVTENLNVFNTVFDEIVSALLTEEMRRKNMDNQNGEPCLYEDGPRTGTKISHRVGDLNLEGDLNLQENLQRWCAGNAERKGTSEWSVNLKLLIKERDLMMLLLQRQKPPQMKVHPFHFTPHREWFCEYEKYDGGDVFLGDDRKARIIGRGKVKLKLQGGRVRTLPGVLHIPTLARNLISVSKLDDAGVKTVFEKDTCKMV